MDKSQKERNISRRDFLRLTGASALAATVAASCKPLTDDHPSTSMTPELTPPQLAERIIFQENMITVWVDREGVPTQWEDQSGQQVFDREAMLEARDLAVNDNRFELAAAQRLKTQPPGRPAVEPVAATTKEKPTTTLPADTLSAEELKSHGVEIIASPTSALHIRQSAFEPGGILGIFQPESGRKLKIVITDRPFLCRDAFADPRYDSVRAVVDRTFDPISLIRQQTQYPKTGDPVTDTRSEALRNQVSDQEYLNWGLHQAGGLSLWRGHERGEPDTDYIFLPIPTANTRPAGLGCLSVVAMPEGSFAVDTVTVPFKQMFQITRPERMALSPDESYTPAAAFRMAPEVPEDDLGWKGAVGVLFEDRDIGFVALHEIFHIIEMAELEAAQPQPEGLDRLRYFRERDTDMAALGYHQKADDWYRRTGDDRLHSIVLENKTQGFFVIG